MTLIKCTDCGSDVSTAATACPRCGAPVVERAAGTPATPATTNGGATSTRSVIGEQTSKRRAKLHVILSSLAFGFGVLALGVGLLTQFRPAASGLPVPGWVTFLEVVGFVMTVAGGVWFIVTKVRIYWRHE